MATVKRTAQPRAEAVSVHVWSAIVLAVVVVVVVLGWHARNGY